MSEPLEGMPTATELWEWATDTRYQIRAWAALHPLPPEIAKVLAQDSDWFVRATLAQGIGASAEILTTLAEDEDSYVREAVAANLRTPPAVRTQLVSDPKRHVRSAARRSKWRLSHRRD